jgi:hypothetical protein
MTKWHFYGHFDVAPDASIVTHGYTYHITSTCDNALDNRLVGLIWMRSDHNVACTSQRGSLSSVMKHIVAMQREFCEGGKCRTAAHSTSSRVHDADMPVLTLHR